MVKEWAARGIDIFLREEVTLFLQKDQQSYLLGATSTDHATTSFAETTTTAALTASDTVVAVTSSTGMTAADNVGVKLDDDSIHWDTIASVDSATQITLTTGVTGAAASGNKVYAYTTRANRPQRILHAFRRNTSSYDSDVRLVGEKEYQSQSNKLSEGPPVEAFYRQELDNGRLYVWPVDGGADWDKLVLISQTLPDDFDAAGNNPEFPIEWGNAIVWNLAAELASEYGLPENTQGRLWRIAEFKFNELLAYDDENASVTLSLEPRWHSRY